MRADPSGQASAWITCPEQVVPTPGRYAMATYAGAILGVPLFLERITEDGFLAAPPVPPDLEPGMPLSLSGPLGQGFKLPGISQRVVLVALGLSAARLLPLADQGIHTGAEVALYCDQPPAELPSAIEVGPLSALLEALGWADFLGIDLLLEQAPTLPKLLGHPNLEFNLPVGQVLVSAPMPCAGLASCGVCAIRTRRGWKLACKDGPVFGLYEVLEGLP